MREGKGKTRTGWRVHETPARVQESHGYEYDYFPEDLGDGSEWNLSAEGSSELGESSFDRPNERFRLVPKGRERANAEVAHRAWGQSFIADWRFLRRGR